MKGLRLLLVVSSLCIAPVAGGCGESTAVQSQRRLHGEHLPRIRAIIRQDLDRHQAGVGEAATRLARGFRVADPEVQEREMRAALRSFKDPARGVPGFNASPMTFLAAIGASGTVIARDADPDRMKGTDFRSTYPVVAAALDEGRAGYALVEFPSLAEDGESSVSLLFVAPSRLDGEVVGAVALGIPLWSLSRRINQQLRVELHPEMREGMVLWVYFYQGDRLFHRATPPDLDGVVPDAAARAEGLARSPGGYTGEQMLKGRAYGLAVMPTPTLGEGVGVVALRGEP